MIIVLGEEALDDMRAHEATLLIEGNRKRTVSRTNLKDIIAITIPSNDFLDEGTAVTHPAALRRDDQVLDLKDSFPFVSNDTEPSGNMIYEKEHFATAYVPFHHLLALVSHKEERKIATPVRNTYFYDLHTRSLS